MGREEKRSEERSEKERIKSKGTKERHKIETVRDEEKRGKRIRERGREDPL